jgi:hypothetical protein
MSLLDALLLDPAPFNVWITVRADGIKGSGTVGDPYNGSTQTLFDGVMQTIASQFPNQKVAIHLGPGTFTTAGYAESGGNAWQVQAGMKILGSGREVTILKRAAGSSSGYVLGHDLTSAADFFELSDVTLDCNLTSSPGGAAFFFVDCDGHSDERRVAKSIALLNQHCTFVKVLGSYPNAE